MLPEKPRVEFEEDQFLAGRVKASQASVRAGQNYTGQGEYEGNLHGIAGWLLRHHIAKTEKSAQLVMIGVIIFNVLVTILLIKAFL